MNLWQVPSRQSIPEWFLALVRSHITDSTGEYAAQLLWQRGIQEPDTLTGFLSADVYQPTSPFAFGQEMKWAINRLKQASETKEKITIWGDFDADGVTATSVLWEGLGEFFPQHLQLNYYIPNRFTESHGLNNLGIAQLATTGTKLIVTCDTGSTNIAEIDYAKNLGIDIIITDHHTLPEDRPSVVSIINPRYFADEHPLFHLSGVAVAYKLVEALYQTLPDIPQQPLENLLDLVAIGLIADLVELRGDCRYLAQKGIQQLQKQTQNPTRPGIAYLLNYCQRSGDRPTDISFGIGPRINAISRIHGDAKFAVELLTSRNKNRCKQLAEETELANTRRKSLQKNLTEDVKKKLTQIDLSTTEVIVLDDPQWQSGILGLVAGQIAQECGKPTILLTTSQEDKINELTPLARGSARSVNKIDLYQLVASQKHLLHRFGGHPLAAGLSLPIENLALFREGINQQLRQQMAGTEFRRSLVEADLLVTVSTLGQSLFRELKLLEPCGMGNPVPKLLILNCRFEKVWNNNAKDFKGNPVQYIKTTFELWDKTVNEGFPGIWWGHFKEEIPDSCPCDVIVELDYNTFSKRYEVRLIAIRESLIDTQLQFIQNEAHALLDWRNQLPETSLLPDYKLLKHCPTNWDELQKTYRQIIQQKEKLALAYSLPASLDSQEIWKTTIGIAKYLSRTQKAISKQQLKEKLGLSDRTLALGLATLSQVGFSCKEGHQQVQFKGSAQIAPDAEQQIAIFIEAVEEEQFQRQYFCQVPFSILREMLTQATN